MIFRRELLPSFVFLALSLTVRGEVQQLLEQGNFEFPPVSKRVALDKARKADVTKFPLEPQWVRFRDSSEGEGGKLLVGLTNEQFYGGGTRGQSLFVQFDKVTRKRASALLSSNLISIVPGTTYRVGIMGRVDKKDPISLDTRLPLMRLQVDWFKADGQEQTGDSIKKLQPLPTAKQEPGAKRRRPMFVAGEWRPFAFDLTAPEEAAFVKVTWVWETTAEEGTTNGVMYFDEATIEGEKGPEVDVFADNPELKKAFEDEKKRMEAEANDPTFVAPDDKPPGGTPIPVVPITPPKPADIAPPARPGVPK